MIASTQVPAISRRFADSLYSIMDVREPLYSPILASVVMSASVSLSEILLLGIVRQIFQGRTASDLMGLGGARAGSTVRRSDTRRARFHIVRVSADPPVPLADGGWRCKP